jgi:protocatechuate 3,4-dioxygenase beta subunit
MRASRPGVWLALLLLAALVLAGLWLRHRGLERIARERAGGEDARQPAASRLEEMPSAGTPRGPVEEPAPRHGSTVDPALDRTDLSVSIEGVVTDATGNAVAGARVTAVERKALEEAISRDEKLLEHAPLEALRAFRRSLDDLARRLPSTLTGAGGAYALRGLEDGEHRVVVLHPDHLACRGGDWILVQSGTPVRHDVELLPGHSISGLVRDGAGNPVAGVRVQAAPAETARLRGVGKLFHVFMLETEGTALLEAGPAVTDALGAFRLTSLEPVTHDIRAVKDGHAWGEARGVAAGAGDVIVTLGPVIRVAGRVVSPVGEPVAGAAISLREPERDLDGPGGPLALAFADVDIFREKERRGTTGEDGGFALEAFSRGAYDLSVRAEGFPELRRSVALEAGPLELGDIALGESREIAGTVVSHDGMPVEAADVWVPAPARRREDRDSRRHSVLAAGPARSVAAARTDGRGAFRLAGLGGESHEVAVLAGGHPGRLLEGIAAGSGGIVITLERGLTIRGTVVAAESGEPLPGARITVEGGPFREETSDEDGRFELRGLSLGGGQTFGGTIAVRASREGFREGRESAAFPDPAATPVAEVRLELRRLGPGEAEEGISGIVRDARGEPLAGALVWTEVPGWPSALRRMEPPASAPLEMRTGPEGTFTLEAPGIGGTTFEVVASRPGLATSRAGPFPQHPGDDGWPFVEIRLVEGVTVEGRITGIGGAPLAGARVRIWRDTQVAEETTLFMRLLPDTVGDATYSTSDGTYHLRRIEPGSYHVEARAGGHAVRTMGPIQIRAGAPARIDLALDPGAPLEGRVVDTAGEPLSGIEVVAFPVPAGTAALPDEEDEIVQTGVLGAAAAVTGQDGAYRMDHLPAGEVRVLARAPGFEPAWIPSAAPGRPLPDLVLARHARITGRCLEPESGSPLRRFRVMLDRRDAEGAFLEEPAREREIDDPGGSFACEGLPAGDWRIRVAAAGRTPWQREVSLEPGGEVAVEAAPGAGRRIEGVVVRRPDGAPIAGAAVTIRREGEGRDLESIPSGREGEFAFGGLDEGTYHVLAAHPEHHAEGREAAATIEISAGEDASVRLELRPAGRVLGHVRGLVFEPPGTDIFVVALSPAAGSGPSFQAWADEKGAVRIDSVRPGSYRVEMTHRRNAPDTGGEWISVPPEVRPLGEVEVRAGEMATFEVEAP